MELKAKLDAGDAPVLLDVREDWEVAIAALAGARHMPMDTVMDAFGTLERQAEIVVYCHTGRRSQMVARFLERSGFSRVHNLTGGIDAWAREVEPAMPVY